MLALLAKDWQRSSDVSEKEASDCVGVRQEDFGDMAQQKETMRQLVKGWTVGNLQQLLEATPLDQIKLSKIYQR